MAIDTPEGHFYLGTDSDNQDPLFLEASDLTTHGVIVGMTGSGKTGLGVVILEEALQSGVPTLIIDPKGDMGNLMLTFPNLLPTDFMPWISESEAGDDVAQAAYEKANLWKSGLERSGIDASRIQKLRDTADFSIYTPGSTSGIPLNVIGSLNAPAPGTDPETLQDEIEGFAASILALVGISGDPLSSREHILLSNIIHYYWLQGKSLDLGMLIGLVQQPPMRKLGVIDLDTFFPPGDRVKLAMKLNGLAASPSFASWSEGPDLDIQHLLYGNGGEKKPQAAIISLSHLSEQERQFVVTLLMSKMVTWMRQQPGTGDLRALIYMDEVFGYVPPIKSPPSKKPILTILKQARAFGVGLVLSTQNPVDIDYKAISNAGTWMIGRLQTDRDKQRLLDGMGASDGSVDLKEVGDTISALNKREFVLHSTRAKKPRKFSTRWAMSYLAGPLTREQISQLTTDELRQAASTEVATIAAGGAFGAVHQQASVAPKPLADNESAVAPQTADTVSVRYLDPSAPYAHELGAAPEGKRLVAALAVRVHLLFDDTKAKLKHTSEWEAIITPLDGPLDADDAIVVDYDDRDLSKIEPEGAIYVLPDAKLKNKSYFSAAKTAIKAHLYRSQELELFFNPDLKVFSRIGEMREEFEDRCKIMADEKTDADANKLREMLARKIDRINATIEKSEDKLREIQFDAESRKKDQRSNQIMDIAGGLLGSLLGGRRSTRSVITGGLRRSQSKGRMVAKSEERLKTAENRYNALIENREALEDELTEDLYEIQDEWEAKASSIESLIVGLEKTDITVDDATLVWIPVS
ncbi:MAG: hypothetical protein ACJAZF_004358 [Granulosicoccus sp.]|jgi:hypothetical protein